MAARRALAGAVVVGLVLAMLAPAAALGADPQHGVKPLPAVDRAPWQTGTGPAHADPPRPPAAGRVIVRFRPGATVAAKARARAAIVGHTKLHFGLVPGLELVDTDLPIADAVQRIERLPGVEYAEPDQVISASLTPNDPGLPLQWGFDQPGDADIDAKAAWNTTHRRSGRGGRGHRLRHAAQPRRPRRQPVDEPGRDRGQRDRRRRRRVRRRRPRLGLRRRRQPAQRRLRARDARRRHARRGRQQRHRRRRRGVLEPDHAAARPRRQRPGLRVRRGPGDRLRDAPRRPQSRTTAGATRAPPPRSCTTRSRPRAPRASWS